jgi:hypothetical protein
MKPGELRRFHDDAFFANEKHLNGKVFMIVEMTPDNEHPTVLKATILVDGVLDDDWSYRILEDNSEAVDEDG